MILDYRRALQIVELRGQYCRAIDELSREQQTLISSENYDGLINLLHHKGQLVDALTNQKNSYLAAVEFLKRSRPSLPADEARRVDAAVSGTMAMLKSLVDREKEATSSLEKQRTEVLSALSAVSRGKAAAVAYQNDKNFENRPRVTWET